jgi:transposase-like protein
MTDKPPIQDVIYYHCPKCEQDAATRRTEYDQDAELYYKYRCQKCNYFWAR